MTLFDPEPFERDTPRPPRVHVAPEVVPTVAVRIDATWRAVRRRHPGVVHAVHTTERPSIQFGGGAVIAWCGAKVLPLTLQPGDLAAGCGACVAAGAPLRRAVA